MDRAQHMYNIEIYNIYLHALLSPTSHSLTRSVYPNHTTPPKQKPNHLNPTRRTDRRPRRRLNLHRGSRPLNPHPPNQHRNNRARHQRKPPMPHHLQNTRNSPRMRRQRNNRTGIMRKHIRQELPEPDIPRRVRLPELRVIQRIFFRKALFESVQWVFLRDGRFTRSAVAGVQAECFAEELVYPR